MIKFCDKTGQGYFDFEKMADKTNREFAKELDYIISKDNVKLLKTFENEVNYKIYLYDKKTGVIYLLMYDKLTNNVFTIYLSKYELSDVLNKI